MPPVPIGRNRQIHVEPKDFDYEFKGFIGVGGKCQRDGDTRRFENDSQRSGKRHKTCRTRTNYRRVSIAQGSIGSSKNRLFHALVLGDPCSISNLLQKKNVYPQRRQTFFLHSFSYIIYLFTDKFSGLKCYNNLCFLWRNYKTVCCFFYRSCSCNLSRLFYISQEICHMLILSGTFQCKCSIFT